MYEIHKSHNMFRGTRAVAENHCHNCGMLETSPEITHPCKAWLGPPGDQGAGPAPGRVVRDLPPTAQGQHAINTAPGAFTPVTDRELTDHISRSVAPVPAEEILQFFNYAHLPVAMQDYSRPFYDLAHWVVDNLPRNAERTTALRKILEAKDCAVRAFIARK